MKKIILGLSLLMLCTFVRAQNGLENVTVEKYYVSNAADAAGSIGALPVGSVTYRVYADLLPGYNFQAAYGVAGHALVFNTSTSFFNNQDYGTTTPTNISVNNTRKNSVMLDSWFSLGGNAAGKVAVLKTEDTDGALVNNTSPLILQHNDASAGIPINTQDGMIAGTPATVTFVGITNTGNGDLGVFDGTSNVGNSFSTANGSVAVLGGVTGPTAANRVLIGQFTTDGIFHFQLNIQIGTPSLGVQNFVARNPVGAEISIPSLTFTSGTTTGPSSSASPYVIPVAPGVTTTSILTVPDIIGGYKMVGIPDGLGAFDNNNGTFTVLMHHELSNAVGINRAHGSKGAFVSKWTIDKNNLSVLSGSDLMQNVNLWNVTTQSYNTFNALNPSPLAAFSRFCSADLPAVSAFYNSATGLGTQERIFMGGEESGTEGRAVGHVATGPNTGTSWELPYLGKFAWENAVASPTPSNKTIVAGLDDGTGGQVYFYIGTKTNSGSEVDKAGLNNGKLFGVKVSGLTLEVSASIPAPNTPFSLFDLGFVQNINGVALNNASNAAGITTFLRPEDGSWDPSNSNDFYFVTTNAFTLPSRLWKLHFTDIAKPELGGTITAVLDGTEGHRMLDNMGIDNYGHIIGQEDVGNQSHNGKVWQYDIKTDALKQIAKHDPLRFGDIGIPATAPFNQDEETSGIIDVQHILGAGMFLTVDQTHYSIAGEAVEGGQFLGLYNPDTYTSSLCATTASITVTACDSVVLNGNLYTVSGTYTFSLANAAGCDSIVTANITINVTNDNNACTIDACDPVTGIATHTPVNVDDNNACTIDACDPSTGTITNTPVNIDDNNSCTTDACDTATGVITHTPVNIDDNSACTIDACAPATGNITHTPVNIDDNNACTTDACDSITGVSHTLIIVSAGPITGNAQICGTNPSGGAVFSVVAQPGATYNWTVPSGLIIINGQGTSSITVSWSTANTGITGSLCVTLSTPCGSSQSCIPVDIQVVKPVQPGSISGPAKVCPGNVVNYSIALVSRATSYTWTLPTGMTITSGNGTNMVTVSVGPAYVGGSISATANNICGSGPARNKATSLNPPTTPGIISGVPSGLCNASGSIFSIAPVANATSYLWTVNGGTIVGSNTGLSITVNWGSFTSGSVSVSSVNGCGTSATRTIPTIGRPNTPGVITGPTAVCSGATYHYSVATVSGAASYTWSATSGSTIAGQGTKEVDVTFGVLSVPNTITVSATNACGTSALRTLTGVTVSSCAKVTDVTSTLFNAYPNPASDDVTVEFAATQDGTYSVQLTDVTGRILQNQIITVTEGVNKLEMNVSDVADGVYLIVLQNQNNKQQLRLIIQ